MILYFLMILVFVSYLGMVVKHFGILPSISDSYYHLKKSNNYLFTLFCWGFAIPAMLLGTQLSHSPLMFLAGAGIVFVGAAAQFKEKMTKTVHELGALFGVLFAQLSIAIDFNMYYLNAIFAIAALIIYLTKSKERIWWIEILAFSSIVYALGIALSK